MTKDELYRANKVKDEIARLDNFIFYMENNRNVKIFNRPKKSGVLVSDYMRDYQYFELNEKQREKLIEMLKEDLAEQENILKEM